MIMQKYLTFDDVGLIPKFNTIKSRLDTDISVTIDNVQYSSPFVPANMNTVIGTEMADILDNQNNMIIYHRFCHITEKLRILKKYKNVYMSCGISDDEKKDIDTLLENGCTRFCIDVAHGHCQQVGDLISYLKQKCPTSSIIAGNVCTFEGYTYLARKGASIIKVGIGGGSICTTRLKTSFGIPQLSAIMLCSKAKLELQKENIQTWMISDGGINNPRDAVIAIANGADMCMMGSKFARTFESAGTKYINKENEYYYLQGSNNKYYYDIGYETFKFDFRNDTMYSHYKGQASLSFMQDYYGDTKNRVAEGEDFYVKVTISCKDVLNEYCGSLRSALTYNGSQNIKEFMYHIDMFESTSSYMIESGTRKN